MTSRATARTTDDVSHSAGEGVLEGIAPLRHAEIVEAAGIEGLVSELATPAEYLLATTGKNLRSTMVLHCANAGADPDNPAVRTGAIAVELGHLATLAHDDVVDDGKVRRGADAVDVVYGSFASGFVGGAIFARAGELIASCGAEPTRRFARMAEEVGSGQMMEFEDLFDLGRSVERYKLAIERKTASLFGLAAWVGAWLAEAGEGVAADLARFGREYGIAFQMADDILDLVAPESATGKLRGKDLQQGVYTLPVIYALQADAELQAALGGELHRSELPGLIDRVQASGGIDVAIDECLGWASRARATLQEGLGVMSLTVGERLEGLLVQATSRIPHPSAAELNGNGRRN